MAVAGFRRPIGVKAFLQGGEPRLVRRFVIGNRAAFRLRARFESRERLFPSLDIFIFLAGGIGEKSAGVIVSCFVGFLHEPVRARRVFGFLERRQEPLALCDIVFGEKACQGAFRSLRFAQKDFGARQIDLIGWAVRRQTDSADVPVLRLLLIAER